MSCKDNFVLIFIIFVMFVEVHSSISPTANQIKAKINAQHFVNNLHRQIHAKEEELKTAETINRNFERMIQLVNILGQVDNFLTEKTKSVIKKLAVLVDDEEDGKRGKYSDSEEE